MKWEAPQKPSEWAENKLIDAILDDTFTIDSYLPAERELAALLGVTRPTLRESLQRLARDGWVEIRHGHQTRVRDYWKEGQLAVLVAMSRRSQKLSSDFVPNLLAVRQAMAPVYIRQAIHHNSQLVVRFLESCPGLEDVSTVFAQADWDLHHRLTVLSQNPVFTLILNGFRDLYLEMGRLYFNQPQARRASAKFYRDLLEAARTNDIVKAEKISIDVMKASIDFWNRLDWGKLDA